MKALVIPTHDSGRRRPDHALQATVPLEGDLQVFFTPHEDLHREVRIATLQVHAGKPNQRHLLPPLFEPTILTLGNRGMMIQGFEEIDHRRLYQGWWIRFT